MSCRVIGRTVEQFFFAAFLDRARQARYEKIVGEFIPTAKNAVAGSLYDTLGFLCLDRRDDGTVLYELDISAADPPESHITQAS